MTLQRQIVNVPLDGGKTDAEHPFAALSPGNGEVTDARFLSAGAVSKRLASSAAPTLDAITAYINSEGGAHSIAEHDGRLIAVTHDGAWSHDEVRGEWSALGAGPRPSQAKSDPHIRGNNSLRQCDIAVSTVSSKTVACTVWHDAEEDRVYYAWHEVPTDGRPMVCVSGPTMLEGNLRRFPKVAASADGSFVIAGTDTTPTNIEMSYCLAPAGYTFSTSAAVGAWATTAKTGAVCLFSDNGTGIAAQFWTVSPFGASTRVARWKRNLSADGARTVSKGVPLGANYVTDGIAPMVLIAHADGTLSYLLSDMSAAETTTATITPTATTQVHAATVTQCNSFGGAIVVWSGSGRSDTDGGGLSNFGIDVCLLASGTFPLVDRAIVGQVRLGGQACWDGSSASPLIPFVLAESEGASTFLQYRSGFIGQPCYNPNDGNAWKIVPVAVHGSDSTHLAEAMWDIDGFSAGNRIHHLPSLRSTSAGSYVMAAPVYVDESDPLDITSGIDAIRIETVQSPQLRNVSAAGIRLWQAGSGVAYTDGVQHAELTPTPPIYMATSSYDSTLSYGAAAPVLPGASVFVKLAFRWRDEKGNLHRSIPSNEITTSWYVFSAPNYYAARWTFPRPFPNSVDGSKGGQQYEVEVYQADSSGAAMYFRGVATPEPHPTLTACDCIIPIIGTSFGLTDQRFIVVAQTPSTVGTVPLWAEEGELLHIPPPQFVDICSTQSRLWGLSGERGRLEVWPSKVITEGYAPEFSPTLVVRIPAEGGECTAIAALDDKVVVFKERAIFVVFGDPGNNSGERSTIQQPRLISSDVGCSNPNSVVEGPFGVAFQSSSSAQSSRAGVHVIDRGLSVTHAGAPAKLFSAGVSFACGSLVSPEKEVRWLDPVSGDVLVWSYDVGKWHTHPDRATARAVGGSSCVRRGSYALLSDVDTVDVDTATPSSDAVTTQIVTAWIKPAGLQGFVRCWLSGHLFKWYSGGVTIEVGYDYADAWTDVRSWTLAEMTALAADSGRVQLSIHHTRQKCEAFRFRITETYGINDPPGNGFDYLGSVLEMGVKRGSFRRYTTPDSRK